VSSFFLSRKSLPWISYREISGLALPRKKELLNTSPRIKVKSNGILLLPVTTEEMPQR